VDEKLALSEGASFSNFELGFQAILTAQALKLVDQEADYCLR